MKDSSLRPGGTLVVTIDGPAGVGKSTTAAKLARRLGFVHLNSGALYRAIGIVADEAGLDLGSDKAVSELAGTIAFDFRLVTLSEAPKNRWRFFVNGLDFTDRIRDERAGSLASKVALLPAVRQSLLEVQRAIAARQSVVVEGRDAGTVVFPDAVAKFYLDARSDVRVQRRVKELGAGVQAEEVEQALLQRDRRDSTRTHAPQVAAADAVCIDTSELSADEVVERMIDTLRARGVPVNT